MLVGGGSASLEAILAFFFAVIDFFEIETSYFVCIVNNNNSIGIFSIYIQIYSNIWQCGINTHHGSKFFQWQTGKIFKPNDFCFIAFLNSHFNSYTFLCIFVGCISLYKVSPRFTSSTLTPLFYFF